MRIAIITGSRAEWGLLESVLQELKRRPGIDTSLVATGAHLNPEHGRTVDEIKKSHIVSAEVEMLVGTYTEKGTCLSTGLGIMGFGKLFTDNRYDLIIVLGDRYEIFAAVVAAHVHRIPVAHIQGGEITVGSIDNGFRHSITKMSVLHFVAAEEYRNRVIQLGEQPDMVFNVGALGTQGMELYTGEREGIVCVWHPIDGESNENMVKVLKRLPESIMWITPNADTGRYKSTIRGITLRRQEFISALAEAKFIIGNSSSGIIEAPALGTPTINIGRRQEGRLKATSILDCDATEEAITEAIWVVDKVILPDPDPPYGRGGDVSGQIVDIIEANRDRIKKKEWKVFYE